MDERVRTIIRYYDLHNVSGNIIEYLLKYDKLYISAGNKRQIEKKIGNFTSVKCELSKLIDRKLVRRLSRGLYTLSGEIRKLRELNTIVHVSSDSYSIGG